MQIGQRYYGVASVLALLLVVPSAPVNADGTTDVYSRNDDGTFSPTATYLVDHDEAIAAYELSPAFQAEGGDTLYSTMADGTGVRIGSGAGFVQFLEDNYARAGGVASNQTCDAFVQIVWKFSCPGLCLPDPLDCELFLKAEAQITCKDQPPCPPVNKTLCTDFPDRINKIIVFGPTEHVCFCDAADNCLVGEGFEVLEFTAKGPVCECAVPVRVAPDPLEPCQNHWAPDPGGAQGNRAGCFKAPTSAVAGGQEVAIRVKLDRMYIDSDEDPAGCPPRQGLPDLQAFEGQVRYLGAPEALSNNAPSAPKWVGAKLQCAPLVRDWSESALRDFLVNTCSHDPTVGCSADADCRRGGACEPNGCAPGYASCVHSIDTGAIYYYGAEVVPCSIHSVQQGDQACVDSANEGCFSAPLEVRTSLWGDVWDPFENVSFTDIAKVLDAFKSITFDPGPPPSGAPNKWRAMLRGNVGRPGFAINHTDVGRAVEAFRTIAYPELGPITEICDDGIDNNCNGAIDEDGAPCTVPAGNGVCMAGVCVVP